MSDPILLPMWAFHQRFLVFPPPKAFILPPDLLVPTRAQAFLHSLSLFNWLKRLQPQYVPLVQALYALH
jgi:hypothetical protein